MDGTSGTSGTAGTCAVSLNETIGPYPSLSQFVRSDIRESRPGLPLTSRSRSLTPTAPARRWRRVGRDLAVRCRRRVLAKHQLAGNASEGIFADSLAQEIATVSGNTTSGHTGTFQVGIAL